MTDSNILNAEAFPTEYDYPDNIINEICKHVAGNWTETMQINIDGMLLDALNQFEATPGSSSVENIAIFMNYLAEYRPYYCGAEIVDSIYSYIKESYRNGTCVFQKYSLIHKPEHNPVDEYLPLDAVKKDLLA